MPTEPRLAELFDDLRDPAGPGFAVAVLHEGMLVHRECAGLADLDCAAAITEHTRFHIVSCSKTFTAAAILLLAADGCLDLEDCISSFLPELPSELFEAGPVRLRHLLGMTSGLRDGLELLRLRGTWRPSPERQRDILDLARSVTGRNAAPGQRYIYTNTNFVLLEEIIARTAGMPADAFRKQRIYDPLGLADTLARPSDGTVTPRLAKSYVPDGAGGYRRGVDLLGISGDPLVSSLSDLTAWLGTWRAGRVGDVDVLGAMSQRQRAGNDREIYYGLGLALRDCRGRRLWCHSGSQPGYKTHLAHDPEADVSIVIVGNREDAAPAGRVPAMLDVLLGPQARTSAGRAVGAYPADGRYFDAAGHEYLEIARNGDALDVFTLGDAFRLYPADGDVFRDGDDYRATMPAALKVDAGTPNRCHIEMGGYEAEYRLLPAFEPESDALDAYPGLYHGPDFGAVLRLRKNMGKGLTVAYGAGFDRAMTFALQPLAPDLFLVEPTAPGVAHKHLFAFQRENGKIAGLEVTMERLKRQPLRHMAAVGG